VSGKSQVSVTILEREYLLACQEEEREDLCRAAELLNDKLKQFREGGTVMGGERLAIMTALHLVHEMLAYKKEKESYTCAVENSLRRIRAKLDGFLEDGAAH